jgi:hypothetical protein
MLLISLVTVTNVLEHPTNSRPFGMYLKTVKDMCQCTVLIHQPGIGMSLYFLSYVHCLLKWGGIVAIGRYQKKCDGKWYVAEKSTTASCLLILF